MTICSPSTGNITLRLRPRAILPASGEQIVMLPSHKVNNCIMHLTTPGRNGPTSHLQNVYSSEDNWYTSTHLSTSPLTSEVVGAPQMTLQQYVSIRPCPPLPSGNLQTPSLSIMSLMLSSHLFFCRPLLLAHFTVPCRIVFAMPEDLEIWPYTFVLSGPISILYLEMVVSRRSTRMPASSSTSAFTAMSSARRNLVISRPPMQTLPSWSSNTHKDSCHTLSKDFLKSMKTW